MKATHDFKKGRSAHIIYENEDIVLFHAIDEKFIVRDNPHGAFYPNHCRPALAFWSEYTCV